MPRKTTKAAKPAPAAPPARATGEQEPAAVKLLQNFTCDVDIGRFYLREMDVSNLQAAAKIDGSHVVLKPLQMPRQRSAGGGGRGCRSRRVGLSICGQVRCASVPRAAGEHLSTGSQRRFRRSTQRERATSGRGRHGQFADEPDRAVQCGGHQSEFPSTRCMRRSSTPS